ncbi:MAG: penicillin acylase family protein [Ferruginibacter sp.]
MKKIFVTCIVIILFDTSFSQTAINPAAIDIVRDSFGVPHIFAKTDAEVAYGLAWAQAEDDFKSMQEVILPAKNLMAAVQGKKGAAADYTLPFFDAGR